MRLSASLYSTFNVDQFARLVAADEAEPAIGVAAVYGLLPGAAFAGTADLPPPTGECAVVLSQPQAVLPAVAALLAGGQCEPQALAAEVERFAAAAAGLGARLTFVASWIVPSRFSGGLLALDERWGLDAAVAAANRRLFAAVAERPGTCVLNAAAWPAALGRRAFSPKGWYLTKDPLTFEAWRLAVADLKAGLRAVAGGAKKLIVLDLDNTLWGGEVGDVGVTGLRLGGHDPAGEAFVDFQRELLALARRGVVLAVVSKNDEALALAALSDHPEMVLRPEHFAGWVIDWEDKGPSVRALCERLNIAPRDAVFIDDNPVERAAVAAELPEMMVPDWPANPMLYVDGLRALSVFDVPSVTAEDLGRSSSYAAARMRTGAPADLRSTIDVRPLVAVDMPRVVQLLNKTNQFNLATRRLTQMELEAWLAAGERALWTVRVADTFADYGLCGVLSLEFARPACRIVDFVMSCRVMSRGVEEAMLATALREAEGSGCERVEAEFVPTERNGPMRRFLNERSGLRADGTMFSACTGQRTTV